MANQIVIFKKEIEEPHDIVCAMNLMFKLLYQKQKTRVTIEAPPEALQIIVRESRKPS